MVPILLIAVFGAMLIRDSMPPGAGPVLPGGVVAAAVLGPMAAAWLLAHVYIWAQGRRLDRTGRASAVRRADIAAATARATAVVVFLAAVFGLDWLGWVNAWSGNLVLVGKLAAAAPVLLVFAGTWWSMYPIERRLREAVIVRDLDEGRPFHAIPTRGQHVLGAFRHQAALVLVPIVCIMAWYETVERVAPHIDLPGWLPPEALETIGMIGVLCLMPVVMRRVWDTVALETGPLRSTLQEMCRAHGVRIRELLVWRTHGSMINGAVMGFVGPLRYVLLTDALLENLPAPQVEAVMAHELGHVRRKHMIWLGVAALSAMLLTMGAAKWSVARWSPAWSQSAVTDGAVTAAGLGVALLLFGFVSRRFEWQADAFAVQHLSGHTVVGRQGAAPPVAAGAVAAMSGALDAVARLNHIPRERFTWRHGSIAARQRRLHALIGSRTDRLGVDREVMVVKALAAAAFIAAIAVVLKTGVT